MLEKYQILLIADARVNSNRLAILQRNFNMLQETNQFTASLATSVRPLHGTLIYISNDILISCLERACQTKIFNEPRYTFNVSILKDVGITIIFAIYLPANGLVREKVRILDLIKKELECLIATYACEQNLNIILGGDFNLNLDQLSDAAGLKLREIMLAADLVDIAAELLDPPPASFHPANIHKRSSRIDGLFLSQNLLKKLPNSRLCMIPWDSDHLAVAMESRHLRQKSTPRAYFEKTILTNYKEELLQSLRKLLADYSYWNIKNEGILETKHLMEFPIQDLQDLGNWSLWNIKLILTGLFEAQSCLKNAICGQEAATIKQTNQELSRLANLAHADKASRLEMKLLNNELLEKAGQFG